MDKYRELPPDVREAIFSVDSADIIQSIAKKNNLTVDKMSELADEIGLLMLGNTEPKDFISNISRRLGVDKKTARDITAEVNDRIFTKIRESLKKIHNIKDEDEEKEEEPELYRPEAVRPPEPPKELDRENILKGIEDPETVSVPQPPSVVSKEGESVSSPTPTPQWPNNNEKEEELSLSPPPPVVIEEEEGLVVADKETLPREEVKASEAPLPPKPQISRRPPEVSEHDGDKKFGPGGDKYPDGDPYREPVK